MDIAKIKVGKSVGYTTSTGTTGRGKVDDIKSTERGYWVVVNDKTRNKFVTVRPGQITA